MVEKSGSKKQQHDDHLNETQYVIFQEQGITGEAHMAWWASKELWIQASLMKQRRAEWEECWGIRTPGRLWGTVVTATYVMKTSI